MRAALAALLLLVHAPAPASAQALAGDCPPENAQPAIAAVADAVTGAALLPVVPQAEQDATIREILARVSAMAAARAADPTKPKGVVEIDLDLTALAPIARSRVAIAEVGRALNVPELTHPETLPLLPGYTETAFPAWVQQSGFGARYPNVDWRAAFSIFHGRYWGGDMSSDEPAPGLADFVRRVRAAGGEVVFVSGRGTGWLTGSDAALAKLGEPVILLMKGRDMMGGSDSDTKAAAQAVIRQRYGEPVAILDDRATNRDAAVAALGPAGADVISIPVHLPGFSQELGAEDPRFAMATFALSAP